MILRPSLRPCAVLIPLFALCVACNGRQSPSNEVLERLWAAGCSGPMARVSVYRSSNGEIAMYRYVGDLGVCSHPPHRYFDAQGEEVLVIPERPYVPGTPEAAASDALAEELERRLRGLELSEHLRPPT